MIYIEMYGRLGNQMFRYAVARALQLKYYPNEEIFINYQQIDDAAKTDSSYTHALYDYNIPNFHEWKKGGRVIFKESSFLQKLICIPYYIGLSKYKTEQMNEQIAYEKKWSKLLNWGGVYWFRMGYVELFKSKFKKKFISGTFEDSRYFLDIREILLNEFTPTQPRFEKNKNLYEIIENTESIAVSVRRGDFEGEEEIQKLHSVCDKNYFIRAIEIIKEYVKNPIFIMFSDDIEWVRENVYTGCKTYYEDGTDPVWENLRMISLCKHFIISNSTFSWWGQWLCTNEKKIVISPSNWFNNDYDCPLIEDGWIKI